MKSKGVYSKSQPLLAEQMITACDDIAENWEIYKERFLKGDFP